MAMILFCCKLVILSAFLLFNKFITAFKIPTATSRKWAIKLIHRDSIYSPYYDPDKSIEERGQSIMKSSIQHLKHLQKIFETTSDEDFQYGLVPAVEPGFFFINFSIGQPPVPQLAVMDTGSSVIWIQCQPCRPCSKESGPIFNPRISSTYALVRCHTRYCSTIPFTKCNRKNECTFIADYIQGTSSRGVLSTEKLTFETSDQGIVSVSGVVFGCGYKNGNFRDGRQSGIFGLGANSILVNKLDAKFSYCIGNLEDSEYKYNQLIFNSGTRIEGDPTPLDMYNGFYYVFLEGISIGEKMLAISPELFKRTSQVHSGVIIDSGSSLTWMADKAFESIKTEVEGLMQGLLPQYEDYQGELCYEGVVERDLKGFPAITLHFSGGAELVLTRESAFYQQRPNVLCLAMGPTGINGKQFENHSIIGLMAQQFYNVAYDLVHKKLSLLRIECELLED